jgi:ABC-type Fe3+ transport system permease subunit
MRLITELARERGVAAIINIHDVALAKRFVPRIVGLREGEIVFDGAAAALDAERLTSSTATRTGTRAPRRSPTPTAPSRRSRRRSSRRGRSRDRRTRGRRRWAPRPLIANPTLRWAVRLLVLAYLAAAVMTIDVNWVRVGQGIERSGRLLGDFLRPDFTSRWRDISIGILESLTMTVVATAAGVLLAIPVSVGAARNLAPLPIYLVSRAYIALSRTFPEVIVAIVFVVMMGFGPFAGLLTLTFASVGFVAKLLAEDIEDIDEGQLEAMRATGASWWQVSRTRWCRR